MKYFALLTGTIDAGVFGNIGNIIIDVNERLKQYIDSIELYITDSAFTDIVFAENSGYEYDWDRLIKLANENGKRFEFCRCDSHVDCSEYGKSYGEAMIIKEALERSKLLRETDVFYKLTGRIFLKNSHDIVRTSLKHKNEFLVIKKEGWCYTHIFKTNREDYQKYLLDSYNDIAANRIDIEHTFYRRIDRINDSEFDIGSFKVWPQFDGIQGTTGSSYSNSKKGIIYHDILCKIGAYQFHSITGNLSHF